MTTSNDIIGHKKSEVRDAVSTEDETSTTSDEMVKGSSLKKEPDAMAIKATEIPPTNACSCLTGSRNQQFE